MTELAHVGGVMGEEVEVSAKAKRRRFSAKEKLRILKLADGCTQVGELGAMLRREGIYSSSLTSWRRACWRSLRSAEIWSGGQVPATLCSDAPPAIAG